MGLPGNAIQRSSEYICLIDLYVSLLFCDQLLSSKYFSKNSVTFTYEQPRSSSLSASCNNLSVCLEPSWDTELYVLGVAPKEAPTLGGGVIRDVDVINNNTCFHISMSDACRMTTCTKGRNKAIARFYSSIRAYIEASSRSTVPLDSRERSFFAVRWLASARRKLEIVSFISGHVVRKT